MCHFKKCLCSNAAHRLNKTLSLKPEIIPTLLKMTVFAVAMRKILDHYANQLLESLSKIAVYIFTLCQDQIKEYAVYTCNFLHTWRYKSKLLMLVL